MSEAGGKALSTPTRTHDKPGGGSASGKGGKGEGGRSAAGKGGKGEEGKPGEGSADYQNP